MKNLCLFGPETVTIFIKDSFGQTYCVLIDSADYDLVSQASSWYIGYNAKGQNPYVRGYYQGGKVILHRFLMNPPAGMVVDHLNHDVLDNRRSNLRVCTPQVNSMNRKGANRNSKTGVRGVVKKGRRYYAQVKIGYQSFYLGSFATLAEADEAAQKARALCAHSGEIEHSFRAHSERSFR